MSKAKKILISILSVIGVLVLGTLTGAYFYLRTTPVFHEMTVELGTAVSRNLTDYVKGQDFILEKTTLDTSGLHDFTVGTYKVIAKSPLCKHTFLIHVEDTVAPPLNIPEGEVYLARDREYSATDIIGISDRSGEFSAAITYNGQTSETVTFSEKGDYTLLIEATDPSGNTSSAEVAVSVKAAPVLFGLYDVYIAKNDYEAQLHITESGLPGVIAYDEEDGFITDKISVNTLSDLNMDIFLKGGTDDVPYSVTNSYGLTTTGSRNVTVVGADALADCPENRPSLDELSVLLQCFDYTYEPLAEPDYEKTVELIHPTLVHFSTYYENGQSAAGSGFIYRITPEYVYLLTTEHVIDDYPAANRSDLTGLWVKFFDGKEVDMSATKEYVVVSQDNELAMCRLKTRDIPLSTLITLKQIYVAPDIYDHVNVGTPVLSYAVWWGKNEEDIIKTGKITNMKASPDMNFEYAVRILHNSAIETNLNGQRGMSGTALVDYKGNLLGSYSGGNLKTTSYFMRLDELDALWERLTKSDATP